MSLPPDPMAEIRATFFVECEELIEALQDSLQTMELGTSDDETVNVVFRAVHSIKGGAGAFGLEALVGFTHRFEAILDDVRNGTLEVNADAIKVFFQAADHLTDLVNAAADSRTLPDPQTRDVLAALDGLGSQGLSDPKGPPPAVEFGTVPIGVSADTGVAGHPDSKTRYRIEFTPTTELFETGNEPALLLGCLQELGDINVQCDVSAVPLLEALSPEVPCLSWVVILDTNAEEAEIASLFEFVEGLCTLEISRPERKNAKVHEVIPPLAVEAKPARTENNARPQQTNHVVRVDLERIERLANLVGELVINQAMLSQSLEKTAISPHSDAKTGLDEFQRLTRDIQDSVMMIRAQPIKPLFQRMSRVVREVSSLVGKDVRLVTQGEATEVDKTLIERLVEPLTHIVRNAVDHGLECPQSRHAVGKPGQGQVRLSAAHRSGRVVIEISDDGAGIDRDRVLQIALDKGLVAGDTGPGSSDIDNLLFLPGFSTVRDVSDLSGRGVGMDVVRTEIHALGGQIAIRSDPGVGTTFSIFLPLTLAVLDGMVVDVAEQTLVLPLTLVVETMALGPEDVQVLSPGRPLLRVRGRFVPVIDLGRELGYRAPLRDFDATVALLVSQEGGKTFALIVDDVLDQRQVVVKGLSDNLYRAPGIAAATILGDGRIALILDPSDIISTAQDSAPLHCLPQLEGAQV